MIVRNHVYGPGEIRFKSIQNALPYGSVPVTIDITDEYEDASVEEKPKKRGRPRKTDKQEVQLAIQADNARQQQAVNTIMTNNSPVIERYTETTKALHDTVLQLDQLATELKGELDTVRTMKSTGLTMKTKYEAITGLGGTVGQLLRGKIDAIKEINKSITDSNNIEIKRHKQILESEVEKNSDARMTELYKAYINMPVGSYQSPFPNIMDATIAGEVRGVPMLSQNAQGQYYLPEAEVTPEMNRILLEGNHNIETVVVADPTTNDRRFEVIDNRTGERINNYPVPSNLILNGLDIDYERGLAINKDINQQYNVIARPSAPEYYDGTQVTVQLDPNAAQALEDLNNTPEVTERVPKPIVKTKTGRESF